MYRWIGSLIFAVTLWVAPAAAFAEGGHDGLMCTGCHALHTAKEGSLIFTVEPNRKDVNPRTKQPYSGVTALCLGCHQAPEKGGQGIKPIGGHMSHPYGLNSINPKVARVPEEFLRDGKFECIGCHDPHPSNPNFKYLRMDTGGGAKMENFCAACHPMKADPKSVGGKSRLFNSMDERMSADQARPAAQDGKSGETASAGQVKKRQ